MSTKHLYCNWNCLTGWYQLLLYTRYVGPRACMHLLPVLFLSTFFIFSSLSTNFIRLGQFGGSSPLASGIYICTELSAHQQFTQHKVHTNYMDASREWKLKRKRTKIGVDPLEFILKYINKLYLVHLFDLLLCKWL